MIGRPAGMLCPTQQLNKCVVRMRCSHAGWEREQQAEPTCHAATCYITIIGRPPALPPDCLSCYPSHKGPSPSDIQDLANKGRLHTTDDAISSYSSVIRRRRLTTHETPLTTQGEDPNLITQENKQKTIEDGGVKVNSSRSLHGVHLRYVGSPEGRRPRRGCEVTKNIVRPPSMWRSAPEEEEV